MAEYNIPQSLLDKVKRAMRMEDEDFEAYLESLKFEGIAYVKGLLYLDFNKLEKITQNIMIAFYIQYALYSKIEKDEISQDKLDFLNSYIDGYNLRVDKLQKDKIGGGVKFI